MEHFEPFDILVHFLIQYYPPIGAIGHKYKTKVTAIGLLKMGGLDEAIHFQPYYQRLMSYKLLVKNLMDNLSLSSEVARKVFEEIVHRICRPSEFDGQIPEERDALRLMLILNPNLTQMNMNELTKKKQAFLVQMDREEFRFKVADALLKRYFNTPQKYDATATAIVKQCLTRTTQEDVYKMINRANYAFFVYIMNPDDAMKGTFQIIERTRNMNQTLDPFNEFKFLARFVISRVKETGACLAIFGNRIEEHEQYRAFFKKTPNITVMFF